MCVVDIQHRLTDDERSYRRFLKSSDSLVLVSPEVKPAKKSPTSIDLTVGDYYLNQQGGTKITIPDKGLELAPQEAVVIYTEQRVAVPLNMLGWITGKGTYIAQGTFVSLGKLDPGFDGRVKVGFYNSSKKSLLLTKGTPFVSCVFLQIESSLDILPRNQDDDPFLRALSIVTRKEKVISAIKKNNTIITTSIGVLSVLVNIVLVYVTYMTISN